MRSAFRVKSGSSALLLCLAILCSLILTIITVTPPLIPTDWARLDAAGVYIPGRVDTAWPGYAAQAGLWAVMVGCLWGAKRKAENHNTETQRLRATARDGNKRAAAIGIVTVMTLVGFGLRAHTLGALPLIMDEIGFAAHASDILHGQQVPVFAPGHNANPSVYSWLLAGAMGLFGQHTFAIRLLPLAFGTLSIPAMYALGRAWWSRRVGLLAAAFLATYPAHIFFSRMSLYNIVDPFFAMLALAYVPHRRAGRGRGRWIAAGVLAGVAQYFYHGSRLVLVLVGVYVALSAMQEREQHNTAAQRYSGTERNHPFRGFSVPLNIGVALLWFLLAFGIVTLPRFAPMLVHHLPVTGNGSALRLPADLGANTARAALAWVGGADVSPFWLSDAPLLEWPALLAFGVGVVVSLRRWREGRYTVLVASVLLTTIFGGAMWAAAPLYARYMTAVPAIGLLVAVGVEKIKSVTQRGNRITALAIQTAVIAVICIQGVYAAVGHPGEARGRIRESQWIEHDLARRAAALPAGTAAGLVVPAAFESVQAITISHALAAHGERRAVAVNRDEAQLAAQLERIPQPYAMLRAR